MIAKLDQNTINQIAAGEVIDRPSSVVKELLENSIDAGATAVTVEIKEGGISLIRLTDNGSGIEGSEIPTAFLRHTTSKIHTAEDLLSVKSLGFRGEALSSIAAVAQVELISKTADSLTGFRYVIEGGEEKRLEEVGAPEGTTILVRNLFYHTPARKKFLKSAATEGGYISDLTQRMALSHPEISLRLIMNNQTKLHTAGNHNLKDIIYGIYGRDITRELVLVNKELFCGQIEGYVGKPAVSKGNRSWENYFINGRYIKSNIICKALEDAFHGIMTQHKYPFCVLHLKIDPAFIDVNVHPSKMEIRFQQEERLYEEITEAVAAALKEQEMIPSFSVGAEEKRKASAAVPRGAEPFEKRRMREESGAGRRGFPRQDDVRGQNDASWQDDVRGQDDASRRDDVRGQDDALRRDDVRGQDGTLRQDDRRFQDREKRQEGQIREASAYALDHTPVPTEVRQQELFEEKLLQKHFSDEYQIIGQLFQTYWLIQYRDNFLIVDQHAAHEKVLFEKLMKAFRESAVVTQQMNPPFVFTLSASEEQLVQEYGEFLKNAGFELEPFGGSEYAVYAMPMELYRIDSQRLLGEIIDGLSQMHGSREADAVYERIATCSCKGAIKGNQQISRKEMEALLEQLMGLENPYTCPHGRPVIIKMTRYELEKKFKRVIS